MEHTERFISLSLLGAMTLAFSPLAFAEGAGSFCDRLEGDKKERCEERMTNRQNIRGECGDTEDREAHRDCVRAAAATRGLHRGDLRRPHARPVHGQNVTDEVKDQLKACKDDNETREDVMACLKAIAEENGLKKPAHRPGKGPNIDSDIRDQLKACKDDNESRADILSCMREIKEENDLKIKPARRALKRHVRKSGEDAREQYKACREEETREDKIACFKEVRESLRNDAE